VIAKYSLLKSLWPLAVIAIIYGILIYGWSSSNGGDGFLVTRHNFYSVYALIGGSLFALVLLRYLIGFLNQLFFDSQVAIWIQDAKLYHLNKPVVRCSEIRAVKAGTAGAYSSSVIILQTKAGEEKVLPAGLLTDSADVVAERLRKAWIWSGCGDFHG
jgi:hypothetical protein